LITKYSITNQDQNCSLITLCEAYEVLSNSLRRAVYDQYREEGIKKGIHCNTLCIDPWVYHGDVMATYS